LTQTQRRPGGIELRETTLFFGRWKVSSSALIVFVSVLHLFSPSPAALPLSGMWWSTNCSFAVS
jgi:hypothetical protein